MTSQKPSITLIGCGKMGGALVRGWLARDAAKAIDIVEPHGFDVGGDARVRVYEDIAQISSANEIVVLAVKPQVMNEALSALKSKVSKDALILSIAAGQAIANFQKFFGQGQPIIRTMPNTPAAIGKGVTVMVASEAVTPLQKQQGEDLMAAAGLTLWAADESVMDAVTALSGSGPAYVFYLIEAMAQAGMAAGLDAEFAMKLARQTVIGAGALAESDHDIDAGTLRKNVTSPGGTTEAGLKILMAEDGGLAKIMERTIQAAKKRGEELRG